jgi:hypothetical protein
MSLICSMLMSVNGSVEDDARFGWAAPDEDVIPTYSDEGKRWSSCRFSVSRTTI